MIEEKTTKNIEDQLIAHRILKYITLRASPFPYRFSSVSDSILLASRF